MEKLHFTALEIENNVNEYDILIVGFYNPEEEHYLMIQLSNEFNEQDRRLGMDTYHIERDDQSYGNYGGVEKVILRSGQIQFILTDQGKENMECEEILIDFETDQASWAELQKSLQKIFNNALEAEM